MIDGTRNIRQFLGIPAGPAVVSPLNLPVNPSPGCCNSCTLKVLADQTGNPTQNDISTVIWWFNLTTTAANIMIMKYVNGAWVQQGSTLTTSNTTYGQFNQFAYYTNEENQNFISLQVNWAAIQSAFGNGSYKFTCNYTDPILGNGATDSYEFCLFLYSPQMAEGTVRLEYTLTGTSADINNRTLIKDYGTLQILNHIRVEGVFGYPDSPYKSEYNEDIFGHKNWIEDYMDEQLQLTLVMVPWWIHKIIRVDFMMAESLAISDYNSMNNDNYISVGVIKDSGYKPDHYILQNINSPVDLKFKPADNRSRRYKPNQ